MQNHFFFNNPKVKSPIAKLIENNIFKGILYIIICTLPILTINCHYTKKRFIINTTNAIDKYNNKIISRVTFLKKVYSNSSM